MKKVMVYVYTTFNLGDDLFIKVLSERYPKTNFVLFAPKGYKQLFSKSKNLSIIMRDSFIIRGINFMFRLFKRKGFLRRLIAQNSDAGVYIGGSLFMQGEKWKDDLISVKDMRNGNKPFFLLGANFGPFKDKDFYIEYKQIFKGYSDICFREKYSYELFKDLENVRMADDIIFQLKSQQSEKKEKNIVISVIKPSVRKHLVNYDDIYYKKIKDIAIYFIEKGYNVTLMSFCENEGDAVAVEEIMKLIPKNFYKNLSTYYYKFNIEEALNVIAQSNFVIATRFHAMILGWIHEKPVFPIVYSEKMTNVMSDVGFKGKYTDFNNINFLKPEQVYESMVTNLLDVSKQVKNAEKHFEKLDDFLIE